MTFAHKHLLAAGLLALGLAASAQTPPAPAPATPAASAPDAGMRGMHQRRMDPARMEQRHARRMAALKEQLKLTPAQEPAWNAFTAAMKPPTNLQRPDPAEFAKLTTPERIDRMRAMRAARSAEMDKRADATKTFYAALTPEQQKVFDAQASRFHGGRRGHHFRHHSA